MEKQVVSKALEDNVHYLSTVLPVQESFDLVQREMYIGGRKSSFYFIDGFTKDETIVIGDRLYTDILSGINAGVETALVLTGEATRKDAEESSYKPDYIFPTVRELHEAWK